MTNSFVDRLSALFREIEVDLGTTDFCVLVLESLHDSLEILKESDLHHFYTELKELTEDINSTNPKYSLLVDSFIELLQKVYEEDCLLGGKCTLSKEKFLRCVKDLIEIRKQTRLKIIKKSEALDLNGKTILVYNHSVTLEMVLKHAYKAKQKFEVIVAEQDRDKTDKIIEVLHDAEIPFKVVPSYMVMHLDEEIDLLFFGALTLKSTMDFVMDNGANGLIAQFHLINKPVYVFLATDKFSLWKAEKRSEVHTHTTRRSHMTKSIDFDRIKFSHDRVELDLITKIVTEEGIFTPEQIEKIFNEKLEERLKFAKLVESKKD